MRIYNFLAFTNHSSIYYYIANTFREPNLNITKGFNNLHDIFENFHNHMHDELYQYGY